MVVNWITVGVAAVVGLAIGAFATGQVGGVVLPLLFVLACPLMMMFVMASATGRSDAGGHTGTGEQPDRLQDVGAASIRERR